MSLLIAIKSCCKDKERGCHDIIRRTWGQDAHAAGDLCFFLGRGYIEYPWHHNDGEVLVDAGDGYDNLPFKTRSILSYSLEHGYDFTFLCDIDTYVIPRLLAKCGYDQFDYSGRFGMIHPPGTTFLAEDDRRNVIRDCHPWASGGVGYFLSRKAAQIVIDTEPEHWAEDLYVGQALGPYIQSGHITASDLPLLEAQASWHFPRRLYLGRVYDPRFGWMDKMYQEHK